MAVMILKATVQCNSNCIYCDAVDKVRSGIHTMPVEVLELFFKRADEFLRENPDERMIVIWHGGEPLMPGPEFFEQAFRLQNEICRQTGSRLVHRIQSNLTLFSPRFAEVFRKMGIFGIGTSYDPIPGIRGFGKGRDSDAYDRRFRNGLKVLEDEGFGWGLIYVVTSRSLERPLDIYHALCRLKPDGNIKFQPVLLCGHDPQGLAVTPEQFAEFLGAIFTAWWAERQTRPMVEPFRVLTDAILHGSRKSYCTDLGRCAASYFALAPDGMISHCGRSVDRGLLDYGPISLHSFSEILEDSRRKVLLERGRILCDGECRGCRFWVLCHGGCPLDALEETGSLMRKSPWCKAKKGFIERYFEPVTGVRFAPDIAGPTR